MKSQRRPPSVPRLDQAAIDEKYGLEPVIDPASEGTGTDDSDAVQSTTIECPYCGEPFDTTVDTTAGSSAYIEDCQVCCRPIEISIEVSAQGALNSVNAQRSD
jgi:Cysteine-rich CPXCG